jgi:hypothetical protein
MSSLRPASAALLLAAGLLGCSGAGSAAHTASVDGRLTVRRETAPGGIVLDAPAQARYCATDSTVTVIAVGRTWAGGIAVRTALPLPRATTFRVGRVLDTLGVATAAFRPTGGVARIGVSGTVRLESGADLDGSFEVSATDSAGPNVVFRGIFARVHYETAQGGACAL